MVTGEWPPTHVTQSHVTAHLARSGPECVPCPNNPYALIIGIVLLLFAAAIAGYYLQRK